MSSIKTRQQTSSIGRFILVLIGLFVSTSVFAEEARWDQLKRAYFGDTPIIVNEEVLSLEAPPRAHDAATVPISVTALDRNRQIKDLYVFVDQNPLPLAGIFRFTEEAGFWHSLETRIRINEYTNVRAVAVMGNGELHMSERFVKASGGCSAPAMSDMDAALARAGQMKLLLGEINDNSELPYSEAIIKISHPNNSGMQFDQISRNYIPAFYVNNIQANIDGVRILDVETNFSMSENPVIQIAFQANGQAETLDVVAVDSKGNRFEKSVTMSSP